MQPVANPRLRHTILPPPTSVLTFGNQDGSIVFVTEPPYTDDAGKILSDKAWEAFDSVATSANIPKHEVFFIQASPPIPATCGGSEARTRDFLLKYTDAVWVEIKKCKNAKIIVPFGKNATTQVYRGPVKVTELQGHIQKIPHCEHLILPVLSPSNVVSRPEVRPAFESQFRMLALLVANNWDASQIGKAIKESTYEWCFDLQALIDNPPKAICFDCETAKERDQGYGMKKGALQWYDKPPVMQIKNSKLEFVSNKAAVPLLCTITYKPKHALVVPLDCDYYPDMSLETRDKLLGQLKALLGNPNIAVTGHNLGFDMRIMHQFGIKVANWHTDTLQTTFALDENVQRKGLDAGVDRWLPQYAGYSREFESKVDYDLMREVPYDLMAPYAGGDTDTGFQLAGVHLRELKRDSRNYNTFKRIQMPALRMFHNVSVNGLRINTDRLRELWTKAEKDEARLFTELLKLTPLEILREKIAGRKGDQTDRDLFNFKSPILLRDILFSPPPRGFGFIPVIFTESTMELDSEDDWVPSTSSKKHLPYFDESPFVKVLEEYVKLKHLMSNFVGQEAHLERSLVRRGVKPRVGDKKRIVQDGDDVFIETVVPASGLWKHISVAEKVHPIYNLHKVVTGRTSCQEPNIQQVPKRGPWAMPYRMIYIPDRPNGCIVAGDLSQIELRLVAEASNAKSMLDIYLNDGDIHCATGAKCKGLSIAEFMLLQESSPEDFEFFRYLAKAVNFGFVYGAWWTTFKVYAKTTFGIDVSDDDAKKFREAFFEQFWELPDYFEDVKRFAHKHGYVRSLLGSFRRLPAIHSPDKTIRQMAERQSINSPIQRTGSDFGVMSMIRFDRDCPKDKFRVAGFVHDQIIVDVTDIEYKDEAESALKFYMETLPLKAWFGLELKVPIKADIESGPNMGELKKSKKVVATAPSWYRPELDR